jgi:hypothetical protein
MTHEDLREREEIRGPSERAFGLVFAVLFALVALLPLLKPKPVRWWAVVVGSALLIAALVRPSLLRPANWLWTRLATVLGRVTNLVMTALLFYLVFVPVGVLRRVGRKDSLRLRFEPHRGSYWTERQPPGPPPETMSRQF